MAISCDFVVLCFYSVVFYLVNFMTNSIVNSSKIYILKIQLLMMSPIDLFHWPLMNFTIFILMLFNYKFYATCTVNERTFIIMKYPFSFKSLYFWLSYYTFVLFFIIENNIISRLYERNDKIYHHNSGFLNYRLLPPESRKQFLIKISSTSVNNKFLGAF